MTILPCRRSPTRSRVLTGLLGLTIGCGSAAAQPCNQYLGTGWDQIALSRALEWLDFGDGARVYTGSVGVWEYCDGSWTEVGNLAADVFALQAYDDGNELNLYAGVSASTIAVDGKVWRFDGASWHNLDVGGGGLVRAMAIFDDGAGPALYAAGQFTSIGGVEARNIARWDGTSWSVVEGGVGKTEGGGGVRALKIFDDGTGPALYVGGDFDQAGSITANHVAAWDGSSWRALGDGFPRVTTTLVVFDDGSGETLYATPSSHSLQRWDGSAWIDVDSGWSISAEAAAVHDDGRGPALFFVGAFFGRIAPDGPFELLGGPLRWDGSSWEMWRHLGPRHHDKGYSILSAGDGSMYVGVKFAAEPCGSMPVHGTIRYDCSVVWCRVDLNCDGVIDSVDAAWFINLFLEGSWEADFNGDGVLNFFDLSDFLTEFSAGCP